MRTIGQFEIPNKLIKFFFLNSTEFCTADAGSAIDFFFLTMQLICVQTLIILAWFRAFTFGMFACYITNKIL